MYTVKKAIKEKGHIFEREEEGLYNRGVEEWKGRKM